MVRSFRSGRCRILRLLSPSRPQFEVTNQEPSSVWGSALTGSPHWLVSAVIGSRLLQPAVTCNSGAAESPSGFAALFT